MDNILSRQKKLTKVTKVNLKDYILLKFADNQEKHVAKVLKKLVESNSMAKKEKQLKLVSSIPDVMYSLHKVHKASLENFPLFRQILLALNARNYKLAKF